MEKKRIIFDIDFTLMIADYSCEREYFESIFTDAEDFITNIYKLLMEYESTFPKYEITVLRDFLNKKTNLNFTDDIIKGWIDSFGNCHNEIEEGVIDTLEYLKSKNYSLGVLSNWFYDSQANRLKNSGLYEYFDSIYSGDLSLKPRKDAYMSAKDRFSSNECVFIGDNLDNDYIGPRTYGFDSILYDKDDIHSKELVKIKSMKEIIERY